METTVSHDNSPEAISELLKEVGEIKSFLFKSFNLPNSRNTKELYTTAEICSLLKVSKSTIIKLRKVGLPVIAIDSAIRFDIEEVRSFLISRRGG